MLCFGGAGIGRLLKAGDKISRCCAELGAGVDRKVVESRSQA